MNDLKDMITKEEKIVSGKFSFGKKSIKETVRVVSTGERKDGKEYLYCGSVVTVLSKKDNQGKRKVLYRGDKIFLKE